MTIELFNHEAYLLELTKQVWRCILVDVCNSTIRSVVKSPVPVCACFLLLISSPALAAEFLVRGTYTESSPDGAHKNSYDLTMAVQDCKWLIRLHGRGHLAWRDLEVGADGSVICELESFEAIEQMSAATNGPSGSNNAVGTMYRGPFPLEMVAPHYVIPFYAFASSCYLDTEIADKAYPIKTTVSQFLVQPLRKTAVFMERKGDKLGLPVKIVFCQEGKPPATNGVLECSQFADIGGVSIPLRVTYFDCDPDAKHLEPRNLYSVEIVSYSTNVGTTSFRPTPKSKTLIADFRFSPSEYHIEPVVFSSLRTSWPTEDETKATEGYKRLQAINWRASAEMTKKRFQPTNTLRVNWIRFSMVILLVCLPLALLTKRYWGKPKTR